MGTAPPAGLLRILITWVTRPYFTCKRYHVLQDNVSVYEKPGYEKLTGNLAHSSLNIQYMKTEGAGALFNTALYLLCQMNTIKCCAGSRMV